MAKLLEACNLKLETLNSHPTNALAIILGDV